MKAIFETSRPGFSCLSPREERRTSLIFYVKYTDIESSQFLSTLGRESEDPRGRGSASFSHSGWRQQVWLQPVCTCSSRWHGFTDCAERKGVAAGIKNTSSSVWLHTQHYCLLETSSFYSVWVMKKTCQPCCHGDGTRSFLSFSVLGCVCSLQPFLFKIRSLPLSMIATASKTHPFSSLKNIFG